MPVTNAHQWLNLSEMPTDDLHTSDTNDNLNSEDRHNYTWCSLLHGAPSAKALRDSTLPMGARAPSTTVSHWPLSDLHVTEAESQEHVAANPYKLK